MAVDGWAVTFGTARRGLGGLLPRPIPSSLYQQPTINGHCTNFILLDVTHNYFVHWRLSRLIAKLTIHSVAEIIIYDRSRRQSQQLVNGLRATGQMGHTTSQASKWTRFLLSLTCWLIRRRLMPPRNLRSLRSRIKWMKYDNVEQNNIFLPRDTYA